jgi:aminoglycoside phosphotransferase (APT) family kinase protein
VHEELIVPTAEDAREVIHTYLHTEAASLARFSAIGGRYVFDVTTVDGRPVVARLGHPGEEAAFDGSVRWYGLLTPLGVPLPRLLAHGTSRRGFPFMIITRLPGRDLFDEYHHLTHLQKRELARCIVEIGRLVQTLPPGHGYGFVHSYDDPPPHTTWRGVLNGSLARSRSRILEAGLVSPAPVERVAEALDLLNDYFATVPPRPFLDDTTTKNVIIHEGRLSGIIDIDWVCFGDPLLTVGLTNMALKAHGQDTMYVDEWLNALHANATQRRAVSLYTAIFAVDFLGEIGQRFNQDTLRGVDATYVALLERVLDESLMALTPIDP